jgi:hypothetical protein
MSKKTTKDETEGADQAPPPPSSKEPSRAIDGEIDGVQTPNPISDPSQMAAKPEA